MGISSERKILLDKLSNMYRDKITEQSRMGKRIRDIEKELESEDITHKQYLKRSLDLENLRKVHYDNGLIAEGIFLARENLF
jgi:hypothetical protein